MKKSTIVLLFVLMLVGLMVLPAFADSTPASGKTLQLAYPEIAHIDVNSVSQGGPDFFAQFMYEQLFNFDDDGMIYVLAESSEESEDHLTHTIKLREGITFHDGTKFDAENVKWNIDRKIQDQLASYDNIPFDYIEVIDEYTVAIHLKSPFALFYRVMSYGNFSMYSREYTEKVGYEGLKYSGCGTGPYILEEMIPNESLHFIKNENYWREGGAPYYDEIWVNIVPESTTRAIMLETGEADIAYEVQFQDVVRLKDNPEIKEWTTNKGTRSYYISLTNLHPPLNNVDVRRGINYAVDVDSMIETVYLGYASPMLSRLSTPLSIGFSEQTPYPYDPQKAMELFDAAGFVDTDGDGYRDYEGKPVDLVLWTRNGFEIGDMQIMVQTQGFLEAVGVKSHIEVQDNASFLATLNGGAVTMDPAEQPYYDMVNLSWGTGDADYLGRHAWPCSAFPPTYWNYSYYCNEEVDALIAKAQETYDIEESNVYYAEAQKIMWDEASDLYLFNRYNILLTSDKVDNIKLDPINKRWLIVNSWLTE